MKILLNSVFLNFDGNNFQKYTIKLIEIFKKYFNNNYFYIVFPDKNLQENIKLFLDTLPENFEVVNWGEQYFYVDNIISRINFEDNLYLLAKELRVDILFTPYNYFPKIKLSNIKFYTVIHDLIPLLPVKTPVNKDNLYSLKYVNFKETRVLLKNKKFFHNNDIIFTVSKFQVNEIKNITKFKGIIEYLPNWLTFGNNFKYTDILKRLNTGNDYILYIGSMSKRKNISGLIKLYNFLPEKIKKKHKLILGGGKINNKNIISTGYLSESDLQTLYKNSYFYMSLSYYEGFGVPPLEALSYKKPLVLSDIEVFREIFEDLPLYINITSLKKQKNNFIEFIENFDIYKKRVENKYSKIILKYTEKNVGNILKKYLK